MSRRSTPTCSRNRQLCIIVFKSLAVLRPARDLITHADDPTWAWQVAHIFPSCLRWGKISEWATNRNGILLRLPSVCRQACLFGIFPPVSWLLRCYKFIVKQIKELIHLVHPQWLLALFQISHKAQTDYIISNILIARIAACLDKARLFFGVELSVCDDLIPFYGQESGGFLWFVHKWVLCP